MNSKTNRSIGTTLQRKLGLFPCTSIVVANMIGAGIFTTSGLLMGDLGDPILMLSLWVVGGCLALFGALSYGELGAHMPEAGGEYAFLSRLYHPLFGFLSGWVSLFAGFSAPIAASALGFSEYVFRIFPSLSSPETVGGFISLAVLKKLVAISVIALFTAIHMRGIEFGARIQNYLTMLKVGLIIALIVIGFIFGGGDIRHLTIRGNVSFNLGGWKTIGLSLLWIMFAYSGWNASTYIGSEVRNPRRNLPVSLLLGTGTVMALYLCLNLFYLYAIPPDEMSGVISVGGLAVGYALGAAAGTFFSLMIAFALFSSLSAFIILGPRVYYAMAQDGCFFRFASKIHPVYGIPTGAILLQGAVSIVMVLSGTFDQILTYMGFSLGIFPLMAVFGVFRLRRRGMGTYTLPGYPVVQALYIIVVGTMLVLSYFERPVESSIAVVTVLTGIPAYVLFRKHPDTANR